MHIDHRLVKLIEFIKTDLARGKGVHHLGETDNLIENGVMDSLAIMKLILFLEDEFEIKIADEDLALENFTSVESIYNLAEKKRAKKARG
jgi:methoxymalonate biosynthesis acyl carrier protein